MAVDVLLTILGAAALLGRVGFALYAAGLVRSKNSAGTVTRALCDFCVSSLAFWAVGAALLIPTDPKHHSFFTFNATLAFASVSAGSYAVFFNLAIFLLATGAVVGAVAERFKFFPLCAASAVLAGIVLPVTGQWSWSGWLATRGFVDIGGAACIHVTVGVFAAVAARFVGARSGKYNRDGSTTMIPGHNVPFIAIGALLLVAGWTPYLMGASIHTPLAMAQRLAEAPGLRAVNHLLATGALNTVLAAAGAGFVALLLGQLRYGKPDVVLAVMGMIGGMVAVTGGAGAMPTAAAVLTGAVAGILVPLSTIYLDMRLRIDDPSGLVAIHAVGGAWGTLAVALFARVPGLSFAQQLGRQTMGLAAVAVFSALSAFLLFTLLKALVGIRAREADEFDGLDLAEHDIGAYPDFQQTMIKSYHLREV